MKLYLANEKSYEGHSFGANKTTEGEVVFTTGMTGYLETLTDPSYFGQIIVFTFPLIGNYGVFDKKELVKGIDEMYESNRIWARGVILTEDAIKHSHENSIQQFANWLKEEGIPAISGVDTRELTQELREHGTILGAINDTKPKVFEDPLNGRFVPEVSPKKIEILNPVESPSLGASTGKINKTIVFLDCGAKNGIFRNFLNRGIRIIRLPFNQSPFDLDKKSCPELSRGIDGLFISNGPGDPEKVTETIEITKQALEKNIPIFGICLGNQILSLAAGGKTKKMKYGHRGVNQPVIELKMKNEKLKINGGRCLITTQNHGYEVDAKSLPSDFEVWFKNLNDGSVEGIRHKSKPIFSVQFHPEACAGPEDAEYLFDEFIAEL